MPITIQPPFRSLLVTSIPFACPPRPLHPSEARTWKAFSSGPKEQWLRCEGHWAARLISGLHYAWPWDRGHWRFTRLLGRWPYLHRVFAKVPFRSSCGVAIRLDIPTDQFLFLSGRLSPEPLELAVISRIVRAGDTFVDVGAHWGLYILHVLGRLGEQGNYFAIEPSRSNFRFLDESFPAATSGLQRLEMAVSDVNGQGKLAEEGAVNAHLVDAGQGTVPVRVARLDTILANVALHSGKVVIKADTEGHEAAVVRGCAGLAARGIRPVFLLEFLVERFGQTRAHILRALEDTFGTAYEYWAVDTAVGGLVRFQNAAMLGADVRNIVAVPCESDDRLANCPCFPPK